MALFFSRYRRQNESARLPAKYISFLIEYFVSMNTWQAASNDFKYSQSLLEAIHVISEKGHHFSKVMRRTEWTILNGLRYAKSQKLPLSRERSVESWRKTIKSSWRCTKLERAAW